MPQTIFPPAGIYAIDVTLPVDTRRDFTSQTINNTNTADNVLETDHFTDNYVNTILDNDVSYPLEVFFLNFGAIDLNFSTHNQFGLKFKITQFSMNLVAMVTKKQDGRHGF